MSNPQEKHHPDTKEEVHFGDAPSFCLKCKNKSITYQADPCGCPLFCTDCARKMATGGRCTVCHEFYGGLRRLQLASDPEQDT